MSRFIRPNLHSWVKNIHEFPDKKKQTCYIILEIVSLGWDLHCSSSKKSFTAMKYFRSVLFRLGLYMWCKCKSGQVGPGRFMLNQVRSDRRCLVRLDRVRWNQVRSGQVRWGHFMSWLFSCFLPARRYASAGLCDSDVSVRLSVTRRYCAYQSESRIVKCIPSDSPITLVSG